MPDSTTPEKKVRAKKAPAEALKEKNLHPALENDTSMLQMAGIDVPLEIDNARNFSDYLKPGDLEDSNAMIMFKERGVESLDIGSETFQSPHTDAKGQYVSFVFQKPGIVLLPMAAWRYFEAEILPSIPNKQDFKFVGVDRKFTKLTPQIQEIVVQHLWDPDLLKGISGNPKCGHLRELVTQRFRKIEERERVVKLGYREESKVPNLSSL